MIACDKCEEWYHGECIGQWLNYSIPDILCRIFGQLDDFLLDLVKYFHGKALF